MGMGPRVLASASSQVQASISVIKKGAAPFPSQEPVLTSTNAPGYPKKSEEPKETDAPNIQLSFRLTRPSVPALGFVV